MNMHLTNQPRRSQRTVTSKQSSGETQPPDAVRLEDGVTLNVVKCWGARPSRAARGRADLAASLQGAHTDRPAADSNPALVSSEKKETRQEYQTRWLVPSYRTQQQEAEMSDPGLTDQIGTPDSDLP